MLFSPSLGVNVISTKEIVGGRVVLVKANLYFNIYAPNVGSECLEVFRKLMRTLSVV